MALYKDLHNQLKVTHIVAPAVYTSTQTSTAVNLASNGSGSVGFFLNVGAVVASGLFTFKLQESSDDSSYTDVAAGDISGTIGTLVASTPQKCAYLGTKQYVKAVVTYTSGTSVAFGVTAVEARGKSV